VRSEELSGNGSWDRSGMERHIVLGDREEDWSDMEIFWERKRDLEVVSGVCGEVRGMNVEELA
jgi:hypothetical protein